MHTTESHSRRGKGQGLSTRADLRYTGLSRRLAQRRCLDELGQNKPVSIPTHTVVATPGETLRHLLSQIGLRLTTPRLDSVPTHGSLFSAKPKGVKAQITGRYRSEPRHRPRPSPLDDRSPQSHTRHWSNDERSPGKAQAVPNTKRWGKAHRTARSPLPRALASGA